MKKIQVVALGTFVAIGTLLTSCGGNISTNAPLKTENDSISYMLGANLYENGLQMHLQQMGVLSDTTGIRGYYVRQIAADSADVEKKASLEKEMKAKIDSIVKANNTNTAEFLKGLSEGMKAPKSKSAYMAGVSIGNQISGSMLPNLASRLDVKDEDFNKDALLSAMAIAMKQGKPTIENSSMLFEMKMQEAQAKAQAKQDEELKKQYEPQIAEGQKFLDENKTKEGVVVLPSGVQYKILKEGKGPKPSANDMVKVHYVGTLIDGTEFDSSIKRKQPTTFNVSNVIKGWTEALQLMPVGSKWMIYIPYDLAYGAQDRGAIKPFSNLIFEVELLDIEKQDVNQ